MINPISNIQHLTSNKGFTIIEALVSVFVLTIGIVGCMTLANQVLRTSEISESRLIAANLSQEGIEVIRNIRDANWLAEAIWDTGLSPGTSCGTPTNWEVDYTTTSLTDDYDGDYLKIDSNGFYNYSSGTITTTFRRKISICYSQTYEMKIECQVFWTNRGVQKNILMIEYLYDWKS